MKKFAVKFNAWIAVIKQDVKDEVAKLDATVVGQDLEAQVKAIVQTAKQDALDILKADSPKIFNDFEKILAEAALLLENLA